MHVKCRRSHMEAVLVLLFTHFPEFFPHIWVLENYEPERAMAGRKKKSSELIFIFEVSAANFFCGLSER